MVIDDEATSSGDSVPDDPDGGEPAERDPRKPRNRRPLWKELPILLAISIVIALIVRSFILQSFWIPSGSMENTLQRGDRVLVNKLVYRFTEPARGEVIVFKAPMEWRSNPEDEDFIKRVIAVGGDTVSYSAEEEAISVNGQPLEETSYVYTNPDTGVTDLPSRDNFEFTVTVPDDRLWVMGDHRSASGDSRENYLRNGHDVAGATIPVDAVVGHAIMIVWPLDRVTWLSTPETFDDVPDPSGTKATVK